ncbi:sulfatase-like hydrolase/transferase [Sphingosinicella sp. YJ22]|uniref:sulfatase-like hydrolase/transferase n=1 Tax=Sphingosinicella sp. YJ22 TaxID=1104780 RepID=UPI00140E43E1|nr:sulfatase-like hydrolase/transferase [Sphingosinicella sp. YJ22]
MENLGATRRDVLRGAASLALAGSLTGCDPRPTNIVFILADDLGYADLSCYGRRDYETPKIDGLAAGGVKLTQGYANSCVCSPTRVALITGRYQQRLRVGLEEPINDVNFEVRLPDGHPTLPSLLKGLGYRTALIGKWHVGVAPEAGPLAFGYDYFFGYPFGGTNYYQQTDSSGRIVPRDLVFRNREPVRVEGYLTDALGDEAAAWIGAGTGPFFLSLHFNAAHFPWVAPGDRAAAAAWTDDFDRNQGNLEIYGQMVGSLDANVGKVLAAIDRLGLANDTIVVFTSDNGGERFSDTWPFTGAKGELLEGGLRVPLIVRWPGRVAANTVSPQVMTTMDFLPTLLGAVGGRPDPAFPSDGEDLMPVLRGHASVRSRRLFWRHRTATQEAVRDGDWKYLLLGGKEHLFNLAYDERERADRSAEEPAKLAELKNAYAAWNASMLIYPPDSFSYDVKQIDADRY